VNLPDPPMHTAMAMGGNSGGDYGNRQKQNYDE
jgi:hypothetical protein